MDFSLDGIGKLIGFENYIIWKVRMKAWLVYEGLSEAISEVEVERVAKEDDEVARRRRQQALNALLYTLAEEVILEVADQNTPWGLWEKLGEKFGGSSMSKEKIEMQSKKPRRKVRFLDCPEILDSRCDKENVVEKESDFGSKGIPDAMGIQGDLGEDLESFGSDYRCCNDPGKLMFSQEVQSIAEGEVLIAEFLEMMNYSSWEMVMTANHEMEGSQEVNSVEASLNEFIGCLEASMEGEWLLEDLEKVQDEFIAFLVLAEHEDSLGEVLSLDAFTSDVGGEAGRADGWSCPGEVPMELDEVRYHLEEEAYIMDCFCAL